MTTLQDDMKKYRNKMLRKEQQSSDPTATTAMDTTTADSSISDEEAEKIRKNTALCSYIADLQSAVEAGLSTVTGILSVPTTSDVASGIVVDFLNGLPTQIPDFGQDAPKTTPNSTIDEFATFCSSHKFLRTLVENPSKVGRLPCFSYTHHSELELSALYKQWPLSQFASAAQSENPSNNLSADEQSDVAEGGAKSCQSVVDNIGKMMEDVLHGRRDISYTDDNVLKLCNETADALCLSVMSIMIRIIEAIYVKLRPQIELSLNESKVDEKLKSEEEDGKSMDDGELADESAMDEDIDEEQGYVENDHVEINDSKGADQAKAMEGEEKGLANGEIKKGSGKVTNGLLPPIAPSAIFELLPNAPVSHRFASKQFDAGVMPKTFLSAVRREIKLLHSSLPPGIFVKTYEDR